MALGEIVDLFGPGNDGRNKGVHRVLQLLSRTDKGTVQSTLANVLLIMNNDPPLQQMLAYDEFALQPLIMRAPPPSEDGCRELPGPYPRPWGAEEIAFIQAYLQRIWCGKFSKQYVEDGMLATAVVNRFHPVRDWLSSLRWDGVKRIDNWLVNAFGCDKTQYHSAVGVKFLIASVRRILQPGTKFDYLLVLEGPQGIGKSTALRELFLIKWFSDSIPPDLRSRDAAIALQDVWCLEFAEIEHLIRSDPETIKAFLSRSVDRYRPVYGKSYVERPRQGVLVGTTNASEWLRDFTGNRRIWPVKCPVADPLWVSVNVEQLWAEAVIREASGETIWLDDECASSEAVVAQVDRLIEDVWSDAVVTWLRSGGYREVKTADVLTHALSLPKDRQDRRAEYRVTAIMTGEGWTKVVKKTKDRKSYKAWVIQDGR